MEVSRDKLKDMGFDWATGSTGAESSTVTGVNADNEGDATIGGHVLGSQVKPSGFNPKAGTTFTGVEPYNAGLQLIYSKLTGSQFEVILHALEEDVNTNTLSLRA